MTNKEQQIKHTSNLKIIDDYFITQQTDMQPIKTELIEYQNGICPILKIPLVNDKTTVIDHKHKLKSDIPSSENKLGFIRGALEFRANAFEGKVWNFYKRLGLDKEDISFSNILRNLADFHDNPTCVSPILHYTEVPKRKKVKVSEYNKVKKYYLDIFPRKKKVIKKPTYVTESWLELVKLTEEHINKLNKQKEELKYIKLKFKEFNEMKPSNKIKLKEFIFFYNYLKDYIFKNIMDSNIAESSKYNQNQIDYIIDYNTKENLKLRMSSIEFEDEIKRINK